MKEQNAQKKEGRLKLFLKDEGFRTLLATVGVTLLTVAFAVFNGVTAAKQSSYWHAVMCGYYVLLALLRVGVVAFSALAKRREGEARERVQYAIYLGCGACILLLELTLTGVNIGLLLPGNDLGKDMVMAIATAAYTFYKIIAAILKLVRAQKKDPVTQAIRSIGFVDAAVSLLVLGATMIATFGTMEDGMKTLLMCFTIAVSLVTIGIGLLMTVRGVRALRERKKGQ